MSWDPSADVEVWASRRADNHEAESLPAGSSEFRRLLWCVELARDDVIIPQAMREPELSQ